MVFSDTTTKQGILEQTRQFMRVDANQWSTAKVVSSVNNYLDLVAGFMIGNDKRFQWDDSNHTKLPIGTTNLVANQSDYSFLTDEQNNKIITLNRVDMIMDSTSGLYTELNLIDESNISAPLDEYQKVAGIPREYDKIADNVIRLYPKPVASITNGLKFYFQRTPSYFDAADTTKEPGVPALLHRGFVIAAAYDGAITLGLQNAQLLAIEYQKEQQKMQEYFNSRNKDEIRVMTPKRFNFR